MKAKSNRRNDEYKKSILSSIILNDKTIKSRKYSHASSKRPAKDFSLRISDGEVTKMMGRRKTSHPEFTEVDYRYKNIPTTYEDPYSGFNISRLLAEHMKTEGAEPEARKKPQRSFNYTKPEPPADPDAIEETPGPATYDVINGTIAERSMKPKGPTLKGSHQFRTEETPGPGPAKYSIELSEEKNKKRNAFSIGKTSRFTNDSIRINGVTPGPGSYQLDKPSQIKGTLVLKKETRSTQSTFDLVGPGPGKYDILSEKLKGKKFRFGTALRFHSKSIDQSEEPPIGPLSYFPNYNAVRPKNATVKIGTEAKFPKEIQDDSPGVGKYDCNTSGLDQKGIKFSKQRRFIRKLGDVGSILPRLLE